ncbi:MAG: aminotransferase class I/II-fold pyridoxal phosphate-dependent enzyme [Ignavibacteriales bacterium]|nr:aminotransferase class I/II-fold pyridoxal phosphate-dependent enzyme [Ignavibacteriales bacterium]
MITRDQLNEKLLKAQYAVRGPIVIRAQELETQGRKIIYCNIGNPQALKQKPLTYIRQVLSLLEYPELLERPEVLAQYPKDLVDRARMILKKHPHGTGAYSQSVGIPFIRQAAAEFITKRDGIEAKKENIILTDGASKGVQAVLLSLLKKENDGFMIPIPQYPLYSASIDLYGGKQIGYFLDEANGWQLSEAALVQSYESAKKSGINPVALVVINPGNPTGAVLSKENVQMIIGFAKKRNIAILADEVYQENVYASGKKFHSFAKTFSELNEKDLTLFSVHSVSKGFLGECGHRGGYLELRNVPNDVLAEFVKMQSISLCSNISGQISTYLMVAPPQPGDESYEQYVKERDGILNGLKRKAEILAEGVNKIEGMSLDVPQGAMYAFVKFELPIPKGVDPQGMSETERLAFEEERDTAYCMSLLEETDICVVPGSGFGQLPHTLHFRTTFLPLQEEIETLVAQLKKFHEAYTAALAVQ